VPEGRVTVTSALQSLAYFLPSFVILVLSLSFHEAAHAWTADRLGDPTARMLGRLTLNPLAHIDWIGTVLFPLIAMYSGFPLIGWAKPVPVSSRNLHSPRRDFAVVALAGPVSNLMLAVAAALALAAVPGARASVFGTASPLMAALTMAVLLNVLLAVFNLIPIPPLDGGNVLAGLVPESAAAVIDRIRPYGFLLLYLLLFSGALDAVLFPVQRAVFAWLP
jgi:Zn-dependent protease